MDTALKLYKILLIKGINVNTANPISHGETNNIPFMVFVNFVFLYFPFFDTLPFGLITMFFSYSMPNYLSATK